MTIAKTPEEVFLKEVVGIDPNEDAVRQLDVFIKAMQIFGERNKKYGNLWKRYGWMGNLLHIQSKAARLAKVFWEGGGNSAELERLQEIADSVRVGPEVIVYDLDDAYDLLNYTGFFITNAIDNNERGGF